MVARHSLAGTALAGSGHLFTEAIAVTFPSFSTSGSGNYERTASGTPTFPAFETAGVSEIENIATGTVTFPLLTASGTAERDNTGTGAVTFAAFEAAGVAEIIITSSNAFTFPMLTIEAREGNLDRVVNWVEDELSYNQFTMLGSLNCITLTSGEPNELDLDLSTNTLTLTA